MLLLLSNSKKNTERDKKMNNSESVERVHTHTHTHTQGNFRRSKKGSKDYFKRAGNKNRSCLSKHIG